MAIPPRWHNSWGREGGSRLSHIPAHQDFCKDIHHETVTVGKKVHLIPVSKTGDYSTGVSPIPRAGPGMVWGLLISLRFSEASPSPKLLPAPSQMVPGKGTKATRQP